MRYLLDTGILLRGLDRTNPDHDRVRNAVRELAQLGHPLVTSRQNIREFWSVCTRPSEARGGLGLSIIETERRVRIIERRFEILNEPITTYAHWRSLAVRFQVRGRQVHDAMLVAIMQAYRITRILTLNASDFRRYPRVEALTPDQVIA